MRFPIIPIVSFTLTILFFAPAGIHAETPGIAATDIQAISSSHQPPLLYSPYMAAGSQMVRERGDRPLRGGSRNKEKRKASGQRKRAISQDKRSISRKTPPRPASHNRRNFRGQIDARDIKKPRQSKMRSRAQVKDRQNPQRSRYNKRPKRTVKATSTPQREQRKQKTSPRRAAPRGNKGLNRKASFHNRDRKPKSSPSPLFNRKSAQHINHAKRGKENRKKGQRRASNTHDRKHIGKEKNTHSTYANRDKRRYRHNDRRHKERDSKRPHYNKEYYRKNYRERSRGLYRKDGYKKGRYGYKNNQYRRYNRGYGQNYNKKYRRWNRKWRNNARYNWQYYRKRYRTRYNIGYYHAPYNHHQYRRWDVGIYLGASFFAAQYWIDDPWSYRLPNSYGPYRWVRYYDDVLLVNIYTGLVDDIIYEFFW